MPYPPIVLDRAASLPLYRQIEVALRRSILDGRIGPGARLPGIRAYARHLGVGAVTVMTAYEQLTAEGYLEARPGRGTVVAPGLPDLRGGLRPRSLPGRGPADDAHVLPEASAGPRRPFFEGTHSRPRFDFRTGSTSLDLFPSAVWERLLPRAWRDLASDPEPATTYRWPEGDPRLRAELAAYLGMSRAVRATPEQVVVTAGAQGAFATAARLWLTDGRTLATEDPSSPHLRRTFEGLGVETIPVPVDDRGLLVDRLPDGPSAVLVTPSWQYPNGGTMPVARRMHLLALGRPQPGGRHRGRLRLRAALRGSPAAVAPGAGRGGPGALRRDVLEGAVPGAAARLRGRARRRPSRCSSRGTRRCTGAPARSSSGRSRCSSPKGTSSGTSRGSGRTTPSARRRCSPRSPRSSARSCRPALPPPGRTSSSGSRTSASAPPSWRCGRGRSASRSSRCPSRGRLDAGDRELLLHYARLTPAEIREGVRLLARAAERRSLGAGAGAASA